MHGVMLPLCISSKAMIIAMVLCCQLKTNKFWPITGPNCVKWRWWTWFSQRVMSIMLHRPQLSVFSRTSHPPLSLKMHIFLFPLFVCCHWPSCAPPPRPCLIFHGWAGGGSASDHISPLAGLPISQPPSQLPRTILRTTAPTVKVWVCPRASSSSSLSSSSSSLSSPPSADCAVGIVRLPASQWHNQVLPHHDQDSDDHDDDFDYDHDCDDGRVKQICEKKTVRLPAIRLVTQPRPSSSRPRWWSLWWLCWWLCLWWGPGQTFPWKTTNYSQPVTQPGHSSSRPLWWSCYKSA